MSLDGGESDSGDELPELPAKTRPKPQRRGNIGAGKLYADQAAFDKDIAAWEAEKAARALLVKEREKEQQRRREQRRKRDRSGQPSGAQKRKKSAAEQASLNRQRNRERNRERYKKYVDSVTSGRPGPLFCPGQQRKAAEQKLLGESFADNGQRVRVTAQGKLHGRCGSVISRAVLCKEDAQHGHVVSQPPKDSEGRLELDERHRHQVLLDDEADGTMVQISPFEVEPWPRIGQLIVEPRGLDDDEQLTGRVTRYYEMEPCNGDLGGLYKCTRTLYVSRNELETMTGGPLEENAWVRILDPHPAAIFTPQLLRLSSLDGELEPATTQTAHLMLQDAHVAWNGWDMVDRLLALRPWKHNDHGGSYDVFAAVKAAEAKLSKWRERLRDVQQAIEMKAAAGSRVHAEFLVAQASADSEILAKGLSLKYGSWSLAAWDIWTEHCGEHRWGPYSEAPMAERHALQQAMRESESSKSNQDLYLAKKRACHFEASKSFLPLHDVFRVSNVSPNIDCVEVEHAWIAMPDALEPV